MSCAVEGCGRGGRIVRGWCNSHYKRWAKFGDPTGGGPLRDRKRPTCSVDDCGREHYGKGYCTVHYTRVRAHGDPHTVLPPKGPPPGPPAPPCSIAGCRKPSKVKSRALCSLHDQRRHRQGTPHWEPPTREERFWAFVDRRGPGECWTWTGAVIRGGYGQFCNLKAHRVAYEFMVGPIPEGLTLDHVCHNRDLSCPAGDACAHRRCVNPDHLEPVTQAENNRRGAERARRAALLAEDVAA